MERYEPPLKHLKIPQKNVWDGNKRWEVVSHLFTADIVEQVSLSALPVFFISPKSYMD